MKSNQCCGSKLMSGAWHNGSSPLFRAVSCSGPDEFNAKSSGFVAHHVFTRAIANEFRRELDCRTRISRQTLHNRVQVCLAAHFQREMMQSNVPPTIKAYDGSGTIHLPER